MVDNRVSKIDSIIEVLEFVKTRPSMYMSEGLPEVVNFLMGFEAACNALNVEKPSLDVYKSIMIERGWKPTTLASLRLMEAKGMSYEKITEEFLNIWISAWEREKHASDDKS